MDKKTFLCADQSILNFLIHRLDQSKKLDVAKVDFNIWGFDMAKMQEVSLNQIINKENNPILIHWAGNKTAHIKGMIRADILSFYEDFYYAKIKYGLIKKYSSHFVQYKKEYVLIVKKALVKIRDTVFKS
jgi:CRISPR/Cas system endoribonuclease Cas6 (RAMP superfamily)